MSGHTPTPWISACFQVYGPDRSRIAHTGMGQLPPHRSQEAEANAAFIVRAVNNHDALVKAMERAKVDLDASLTIMEFNGTAPAYGIRQTLEIVNAALATAGAKK